MPHITIEAPAKLNLHLHIGGRRPDGFHEIQSLFLALAFGDTLFFETVPAPLAVELGMDWRIGTPLAIPPEKNIISKAISLFRDRTGFNQGLKITVEKRIPPGGGLGGGSSNAAAALLALNRLASGGTGLLNDAELAKMGAVLGSDVPFFLHCAFTGASAAWVSGRGEKVQPFNAPELMRGLSLVLVNPGFPSDTAEAYRLLDSWRGAREQGAGNGDSCLQSAHVDNSLFLRYPVPSPRFWPFFNDFLPVLTSDEKGTAYQRIISGLRDCGADFAGLSGSGSTCFGVFSGADTAELAKQTLQNHWPFVIVTRNI